MSEEDAGLTKGTITGDVNFPPFEDLAEADLRETQKYQVKPLGMIQASPIHIPYNSEKKNFWQRTGRDSFERERICPQFLAIQLILSYSLPLHFPTS
jgi:hypothetical protein